MPLNRNEFIDNFSIWHLKDGGLIRHIFFIILQTRYYHGLGQVGKKLALNCSLVYSNR
jgi:hypothetical protein